MSVLITVPPLHKAGGVSNYFNVIRKYLSLPHCFVEVGACEESSCVAERIARVLKARRVLERSIGGPNVKVDLVHVNPSFDYTSLPRDGFLLNCAKRKRVPVLVFFHGWNTAVSRLVDRRFRRLFKSIYGKANAFIVLSTDFKNQLLEWGINMPVHVETTPVDDALVDGYVQGERRHPDDEGRPPRILFLARIEKEKGILESIRAAEILMSSYPSLELIVAGVGSFLDNARRYAEESELGQRVRFLGYVQGEEKVRAFKNADIYLFPTSHGEGMPTSLLEAMAMGLPIVTRPVGGIRDFFRDGVHGLLAGSTDPGELASKLEDLLNSADLCMRISRANYEYARKRFLASVVAQRLEGIYRDLADIS